MNANRCRKKLSTSVKFSRDNSRYEVTLIAAGSSNEPRQIWAFPPSSAIRVASAVISARTFFLLLRVSGGYPE